ncbi:hypothetical protein PAXINDRAFT_158170 [Paxillus involutus ATCC 200175]|uniref:Uncharacterized protein n=1 Tax=Paxillus involutus ATCC 200175 TaxID=664439 RepID=A0A0C9SNQ5_PAXIN|nr:hypothetical protein PAXINDRAFT_158170 [Paxillus involutus ATCC 200175]
MTSEYNIGRTLNPYKLSKQNVGQGDQHDENSWLAPEKLTIILKICLLQQSSDFEGVGYDLKATTRARQSASASTHTLQIKQCKAASGVHISWVEVEDEGSRMEFCIYTFDNGYLLMVTNSGLQEHNPPDLVGVGKAAWGKAARSTSGTHHQLLTPSIGNVEPERELGLRSDMLKRMKGWESSEGEGEVIIYNVWISLMYKMSDIVRHSSSKWAAYPIKLF